MRVGLVWLRAPTIGMSSAQSASDIPGRADPRVQPLEGSNTELVDRTGRGQSVPRRDRYDLVVIGGGTAGLVSSAIAAELGARVLLVERSLLGGDCLVAGCVPSKTLIRSARAAAELRQAHRMGIRISGSPEIDFRAIMERVRRVRARIAEDDSVSAFERRGIEVVIGDARFTGSAAITVNDRRISFSRAIIATGSRPRRADIPGLRATDYYTNESIFGLTELPRRLVLIGGGPLGCELAQAFARLGSRVTLVERGDRIMGPEDDEASEVVKRSLEADGVRVLTRSVVERAEGQGEAWTLHVKTPEGNEDIDATHILMGVGREAVVDELGLETAGVARSPKGITVNDRLRTTNPRVYAAGDCCLAAKFTHAADASARIAVRNALFLGRRRASRMIIPRCTYTSPEIASVGETGGDDFKVLKLPLGDVDRAVIDGTDEGWLKIFYRGRTKRIAGAVLVGDRAGDLISVVTGAMQQRATLEDISNTIFPYPTNAEVVRMAADAQQLEGLGSLTRRAAAAAIGLARWLRW